MSLLNRLMGESKNPMSKVDFEAKQNAISDPEAMKARIDSFLAALQARENEQSSRNLNGIASPMYNKVYGRRYARIMRSSGNHSTQHCRVDMTTGDIVKDNNCPDTTDGVVVGNIFNYDFGLGSLSGYGANTSK